MHQRTIADVCVFEGKGLHTGKVARMAVKPAAENTGVVFIRTDMDNAAVEAVAANVSDTSRSTTITKGGASVHTVEHILSALTGMGIDNAVIEIDNEEVPILDGSARFYVEAFAKAGVVEQEAERRYIEVAEEFELCDEKSGSRIRVTPADRPSCDVTVDFGSKVLGVQTAHWDETVDYAEEIGKCRTFVFFHEIEFLFANNLIKGGDVDNAIVIVEHPVTEEQLDRMSASLGKPKLQITESGYLNNLELRFENECGRHKLLDLIGDFRLAGGFLKAHIEAYKPGHSINTKAAKAIGSML